jgi:hypothetical protein
MAGPVYKMFHARMTEAWFQLSKEEQDALFGKIGEALKKVGGKSMINCDSSWASEKWWFWGVEEYPGLEALQEHARLLAELNWMRYCQAETLLGTAAQD